MKMDKAKSASYKNDVDLQTRDALSKLLIAVGSAYLLVVLIEIYYRDVNVLITVSVGLITLIIPYYLLKRELVGPASTSLAIIAVITLTASATVSQGIHDPALIAFPIIYFFASISLNRLALRISFGISLLAIFWLTVGDLNGWYTPQPTKTTGWGDFFIVAAILGVALFVADSLTRSLRNNLKRAEHEITERAQAEEALRDSEEKYRLIVENAHDGIEISQSDRIIFSNSRFAEMLGYTPSEILQSKFSMIFTEQALQDLNERTEMRAKNLPVPSHYETSLRKKDGSTIVTDVKYEIIEYRGKPATFAIIRDITEQKLADEELKQSHSLRKLLLDIITHDLKNPIGIIYALSEKVREDLPNNKFLDAIYSSSESMMEVFDQTTILSQATLGETIPKETLSLGEVMKKITDEFSSSLSSAKMELSVSIPPDLNIHANPLVGEVFKNYINNAIKYASSGTKLIIEAFEEDQSILIVVKDFGETIAEADRERIFERQLQLENEKKVGQGLGLAIVRRIAIAHDGEAWVEPNVPQGNSFWLRLPS